jgi:leucyl-tRNA synthetase
MKRYNPKDIEPKWQAKWQEDNIYAAIDNDSRQKFVMLSEFPYPSGDGLHMGHIREYTLADIIARYKRNNGMNVLYPMGYDAFGLPAENYAIKNKIAPQVAVTENVKNFQKQFETLGYSIDWSRVINTTDPSYYKWTQWLFLQFFKEGLAYQKEISINWCPFCKTGLANEEVVNGRHERCDNLVEKKFLKQWLLKITNYADRLIDGLKDLDYPSKIADQQINWIGRSVGAEVVFKVVNASSQIKVFTTRPDTLFGASFLVIAPEHPLVGELIVPDYKNQVDTYLAASMSKTEIERQEEGKEKTGVFTGSYAINPVNNQKLPIWIADYVLASYGTGAIMAVPAHDNRDWEFAKKFNLPIKRVIKNSAKDEECTTSEGIMMNSESYDGLKSSQAREKIVSDLEKNKLAVQKVNYKLRDWIFSRQHYWGEPIPIIHCQKHGPVAVPDEDLPVELPEVEYYEPTDTGESPLSKIDSWVNTVCPICKQPAKRETDTMPNWAGSSWYYLRYFDAHNNKEFASQDKLKYWQDADLYLGGMEHTTLHLLYSRFWHQFLYDQGLVPTPEPYKARRGQGIILAADGSKMSKSKGNVVNPIEIIDQGYGADAVRLAIVFLAPYDQTTPWSPESVTGMYRFLNRVWNLTQEYIESDETGKHSRELDQITHSTIKKVTHDLEKMNFNTAISSLMEMVNELYKLKEKNGINKTQWNFTVTSLLQMLAPFSPHITEELHDQMGQSKSIHLADDWPKYDEKYLTSDKMEIVVQVNGKVRAKIEVIRGLSEDKIYEIVMENPRIVDLIDNKELVKKIYIPNKLVSLVVK